MRVGFFFKQRCGNTSFHWDVIIMYRNSAGRSTIYSLQCRTTNVFYCGILFRRSFRFCSRVNLLHTDDWKACYGTDSMCVANPTFYFFSTSQFVYFRVLTKKLYLQGTWCTLLTWMACSLERFLVSWVFQESINTAWTAGLEFLNKENREENVSTRDKKKKLWFKYNLWVFQGILGFFGVSDTHALYMVVISKVSCLGISHRQVSGPHAGWILKRRKKGKSIEPEPPWAAIYLPSYVIKIFLINHGEWALDKKHCILCAIRSLRYLE